MKLIIHESPVGPLSLVSDGQALAALAFENQSKRIRLLEEAELGSDVILDAARRQLDAYFNGRRKRLRSMPPPNPVSAPLAPITR